MAYSPITGAPFQYQKENGGFAANYYLKFYASGTTNPILAAPNQAALDENGVSSFFDKIRLNAMGYPVNASGGVIIPHLDQEEYKIVLYKRATDADNNDTSSADWVVDNVALRGGTTTIISDGGGGGSSVAGADDISYVANTNASAQTVQRKLREMLSVQDFGADPTGGADSSTAFSTALLSGLNIYIPEGTYLIGGIVVQTDYQSLHFDGGVTLRANGNNVTLFKQAASYSQHTGGFLTDSNSNTGVTGLVCGPISLTDTSIIKNQLDCNLPEIIGDSGIVDLVVVQCGPELSGTQSFNEGNVWPRVVTNGATRGMRFKSAANAGALTPRGHVIKQFQAFGGGNTGIDVEAGSDIEILVMQCDGISTGGAPNSTATALVVDYQCSTTNIVNDNVKVHSGYIANCTRDIYNNNATTSFGDLVFTESKTSLPRLPYFSRPSTWKTQAETGGSIRYRYDGNDVVFDFFFRITPPGTGNNYTRTITTDFSVDSSHFNRQYPISFNEDDSSATASTAYFYFSAASTIVIAFKRGNNYSASTPADVGSGTVIMTRD